jgi:1-deoxyxylulose-5-phosphate synthase
MQYVSLGQSGLKVSRLCLGCMTFGDPTWRGWDWVLDEETSKPIIDRALDLGINFFDTADMYSVGASEEVTGRLTRHVPRNRLVIATKLYNPMSDDANDRGLSRKHVFEAVDASLKRLGTDYIDLYQIHRFDYDTPLEETLDALDDVVRAGKVRYLGASSMQAWQFMKALGLQRANGWAPFISMQNHYNLLYREEEREMLPLCRSEGVGIIPWSPLARGFLAGNRKPNDPNAGSDFATARARGDEIAHRFYWSEQDFEVMKAVESVAARHEVSMAQVAYAWVASRPGVTAPIVGISKLEQFDDAIACLELRLRDEDVKELEAAYRSRPIIGHV